MPDEYDKVDQKIIDRSAREFTKSIESGALYRELKKKIQKKMIKVVEKTTNTVIKNNHQLKWG